MGAPTNNKQVLRDYRLALYQEQLGTVDLEFKDESDDSGEGRKPTGFEIAATRPNSGPA